VATAVELAEETVEDLANLSISELVTRLEAATTTRDRGSYNALLANKFTDEGYIITLGAGNDFQILNGESPVNLEISAENLGAIMVLMSMDQADIDNDVLDENIPNNIFDGVVRRYEFRNTNDNELWTAQDFIVDAVRTTSEVEANKTTCIGQIDAKIVELRNELEADGLNENQKSEIRRLIQKLEVAKIFVRDQNIFSRDSLVIAQYVGETHRDIAHLLGTTADAQRRR